MTGDDATHERLPADWQAVRRWAACMLTVVLAVVTGRIVAGPVAAILAGTGVLLVALIGAHVACAVARHQRHAAAKARQAGLHPKRPALPASPDVIEGVVLEPWPGTLLQVDAAR